LINRIINGLYRYIPNKSYQQKIKQISTDPSSRLVSKIIYWMIIIFFLTAATEILGLPIITTWLSGIVNYLPNILLAAIIVFSGIISGRLIRDIISSAVTKTGAVFGDVLGRFTQYAIIAVAILIAITQIGIDLDILTGIINIVLAAILFGAALAFGLGARTSVSNILACYYLQNRYQEGNIIKINDTRGRIVNITATFVIIETEEGQITVPAKKFSEESSILLKKGD
jgi:small-conductance mechanosensitive channel